MKRKWNKQEERYFGIGVFRPKTAENIGTLWRTALSYEAQFIFIIDAKYKRQSSDVFKTWSRIPLFKFDSFEHFYKSLPYSCKLVGIEMDGKSVDLKDYVHPHRAIYLLGSEDNGLPSEAINQCHDLVKLDAKYSLNVAVAGSLVIYDRHSKGPE